MIVPDGWAAFRQLNRSYYTLHWLGDDGTRIPCGSPVMTNRSRVTEVPNLTTITCSICTMMSEGTWKDHIRSRQKRAAAGE